MCSLSIVGRIVLQLDSPIRLASVSKKIFWLTTCAWAIVIFAYYEANLTSEMTNGPRDHEIRSFQEAYELGYTVVLRNATFFQNVMSSAKKGTALNKLYEENSRIIQHDFKLEFKYLKSLLEDEKTLTFGELQYSENGPFTKVGEPLFLDDPVRTHLAIGMPIDSEFIELFEYYLLKMKMCGLLHQADRRQRFNSRPQGEAMQREMEVYPLGFQNLNFPFSSLALGVTLSLGFVLLESVSHAITRYWEEP